MTGVYVCRSCRNRLLQHGNRPIGSQWHSKATFISLTAPRPPSNSPSDENSHQGASGPSSRNSAGLSGSGGYTHTSNGPLLLNTVLRKPTVGRYSKFLHPTDNTEPNGDQNAPVASRPGRYSQFLQPTPPADDVEPEATLESRVGARQGRYSRYTQPGRSDETTEQTEQGRYSQFFQSAHSPEDPTHETSERPSRNSVRGQLAQGQLPTRQQVDRLSKMVQEGDDRTSAAHRGDTKGKSAKGELTLLEELLDAPGKSPVAAWSFFIQNFGQKDSPAFVKPAFQDLSGLVRGTTFRNLLLRVFDHWCSHGLTEGLPDPSTLIAKFKEVDIMRPEYWGYATWFIVARIHTSIATNKLGDVSLAAQLNGLISVWKACFAYNGSATTETTGEWKGLPEAKGMTLISSGSNMTRDIATRLNRFLPGLFMQKNSVVPPAALATFHLLTQQRDLLQLTSEEASEALPFVEFIARLIPMAHLLPAARYIEKLLQKENLDPEYVAKVVKQIEESNAQAMLVIGAGGAIGTGPKSQSEQEKLESFFLKRISRAVETADVRPVDRIWNEVQRAFVQPGAGSDSVGIPIKLYNHFLRAFMTLRHPDRAIDVWNFMLAQGVKPIGATWTEMLAGCNRAKDPQTLERVWEMMLASGTKPDNYAWTTRIYGLMSHGMREHGLRALEEMGHAWKQAEQLAHGTKRKSRNSSPTEELAQAADALKPTTEILNAAVTVLARQKRRDLIQKVFLWADSCAIKPDSVTFNTLIRMSLQENKVEEALKLLEQMESMQVEPDIATFTIILDSMFKTSDPVEESKGEQSENMIRILTDLESRGLKANGYVFSTMIDGLLKHHKNFPAVQALLAYMDSKNIPPSPFIHTMLVTHYFDQDPPDFEALDALWHQVLQQKAPSDVIFFDRMVEGYARYGEVGKMMTALQRMSREGKSPGWQALTAVLKALSDVGDATRMKQLISDVKNGQGLLKNGVRAHNERSVERSERRRTTNAGNQEARFWNLVHELGLDEATEFDQISSETGQSAADTP